ncbi:DoxX family protein [Microvirga solisilvae]|uniref:DoxX family protein n=1 Tax=Microvirga solisilvae TaxID=2919498 RepID=UPI001FB04A38|nr:DoxX family protein [Microvirga solisilvae]
MSRAIDIAAPNAVTSSAINPASLWAGRILGGLVILFLVMDSVIKLVPLQVVAETTAQLGWPTDDVTLRLLGVILLACTLLYAYPRTSVLGALLLTAYLGGAVATHARIGSPLFTHTLFGVYVGLAAWGSLWLRNPHLRRLLIPGL